MEFFRSHKHLPPETPRLKVLYTMMLFVFRMNYFKFGQHYFLQTCSCSMGSKMSVCFASLFIANSKIHSSQNSPHIYNITAALWMTSLFYGPVHGKTSNATWTRLKPNTQTSNTRSPLLPHLSRSWTRKSASTHTGKYTQHSTGNPRTSHYSSTIHPTILQM